jgi:hypothetical protein
MLKAAGMSRWWFMLNFIGLFGIRQIVWCFKIAKVLGKSSLVGFLLILPVTNIFAFFYLVLSGNGSSKATPPKVISLQGGERRQAA